MAQEIYKNVGETTSELAMRLKKMYGYKKVAICGKLDPMARGITKYVADENTKLMNNYLYNIKTYEFYLVLNINTDTDDIMGIVRGVCDESSNIEKVNEYLQGLMLETEQHFHPFSAIKHKIGGVRKSLHQWALEGVCSTEMLPKKATKVYNMTIGYPVRMDLGEYINIINSRLSCIPPGNHTEFRIDSIKHKWNELMHEQHSNCVNNVVKLKIRMTVSGGYYIRIIPYYLYERHNIRAHIYDIHRIVT